ncbi:MAG: TRAP transporter substrate-binding protein [Spirochaetes bacterium]|nr:TRAP transporter substrate-binding protein [Spirochaetota bacterium]
MIKKFMYLFAGLFLIFGLVLSVGSSQGFAKTYELRFAHPYPSMHPQHKEVLEPWAKTIEKKTNGQVKITFITGGALGKPGRCYDAVEKGIVDIGWDISDYSPGKFPLTTVIELPFMVTTAEKSSVAIWKTYEKFPEFQKEYSGTKLLALSGHTPGFFATVKKPIRKLDDLKGMKIKAASSFTTDALQLFGAVPVTQPVTETYTSLERGVLDGVVNPFDGMVIFKLHERLKYYTPANFYTMVFWIAMNQKKFNSLPKDVQAVIEKNSGLVLSEKHGKSFDETYARFKKIAIKSGLKEVPFAKSEMKKLVKMTTPLKDKWVKDMEDKGLPGKAVLDYITNLPR